MAAQTEGVSSSFFSDSILNKKGPLGKVWLASHLERKLSKSALLQTSIPKSVTAILGTDVVPVMALRLSGQLLLGVARIYSRKAKYLHDDCTDALVKIKLAFKQVPNANGFAGGNAGRARIARADVDMAEDEGGRANINLNLGGERGANDFDMLYNAEFGGFGIWDNFNINALETTPVVSRKDKAGRSTIAKQADITLREDHHLELDYDRTLELNFGDELGIGSQEFRAMSAELENGGIGDDFELGLDLDLELDLGLMDDDEALPAPLRRRAGSGSDWEGDENEAQRAREDSPAAFAARQAKNSTTSRVASIAAEARARSEAPSEPSSEVPSVELGRHASVSQDARDSIAPELLPEAAAGMDDSVLKGAQDTFDLDTDLGGGADFGAPDETAFDFGLGNDTAPSPPRSERERTPRATSEAASVHAEGQPEGEYQTDGEAEIDLTPTTAGKIANVAAVASAQRKRKEAADGTTVRAKSSKQRKQIVDSVTELADRGRGLGSQSQSQGGSAAHSLSSKEERLAQGLIKQPRYLSPTTIEMRFQEIYDNPSQFFFAGMGGFASNNKGRLESFYAGPPGMPQQLQALFTFSVSDEGQLQGAKRPAHGMQPEEEDVEAAERRKRARSSTVPDVELGRDRQRSLSHNDLDDFDLGGGGGPDGFNDDFDLGLGGDSANDFSLNLDALSPRADVSAAAAALEKTPSRLGSSHPESTPGPIDHTLRLDLDGIDRGERSLLAVFDETPMSKEKSVLATPMTASRTGKSGLLTVPGTRSTELSAETSQHSLLEETVQSASAAASRGKTGGWSRNTVKALKILEHELGPAPSTSGAAVPPKSISFDGLADKATRRGAASMFFEMLVLGTRDCIKLEQPEAYGDIAVSSKSKLWEVCNGLNQLTVEPSENGEDESQAPEDSTPSRTRRSRDAGATPTSRRSPLKSQADALDNTPTASARSRRSVQMSI